ncbi:DUF2934 domain-containing protein [Sorangium cellulosum]|uniref:DUF2934 domain-containing protein n=1 Tax=Sorangium cellulosum TaxID=56 RepID=UPI003D9A9705
MKNRHVRFRVQARAVGFAFSQPSCLLNASHNLEQLWNEHAPRPTHCLAHWKHEWEIACSRIIRTGDPLRKIQEVATEVLKLGGPWMTLRPMVESSPEDEREVATRALVLWKTRGSPFGDDWVDWFEAESALRFEVGDEILRWRWLSLSLPPLVYIAAATPPGSNPPTQVRILDPSISPAGEVALLHAHLGAMVSFENLWNDLGLMFRGDIGSLESEVRHDNPLGEADGGRWVECLRKAFIVRGVLSRHSNHSTALDTCTRCRVSSPERNVLSRFVLDPREPRSPIRDTDRSLWDVEREALFLRDAFGYCQEDRGAYSRLFQQYLRVKVLLYRHLVADADSSGLVSFKKYQRRISRYSSVPDGAGLKSQVCNEIGLKVRCVEIRRTPGYWDEIHVGIRPFVDDAVESAWVIHFSRSGGVAAGPGNTEAAVRKTASRRAKEARRLEGVIRDSVNALSCVRGLDIAGLEHEGPLWSFLRHLRSARDASRISATKYGNGLEPLRLTIHAGEDFDHLASGLRAVHEPFAWRIMERGDRLGHALALGINPRQWCQWVLQRLRVEGCSIFRMRPWDRLLDIGWLHHAVRRFRLGLHADDLRRLGEEGLGLLQLLGWDRDESGVQLSSCDAPSIAESLWLGLGLEHEGPFRSRIVALRERVPLHMLRLEHVVAPDADIHLLRRVQKSLVRLVAQSGVAIEVNPTSNMIIAGLPNPLEQPMFHIRSTKPDKKGSLLIAISTDDPLTFATCLSDEFAYAWAGMVLGCDVSANYARAWLDDAAATSMRMRFTQPSVDRLR